MKRCYECDKPCKKTAKGWRHVYSDGEPDHDSDADHTAQPEPDEE